LRKKEFFSPFGIVDWAEMLTFAPEPSFYHVMPANKNALIRYKTIDNCLRNRYRRWTLDDLVDACSYALYDMEGITKGVSVRTVQGDIQMMRSDKLGYHAPIEVYDGKYYRYKDPDFSITSMPMSQNDYEVMQEAVDMLRQLEGFDQFAEMSDVIGRLQDKLAISRAHRRPIIHFDSVPNLKGLQFLNPIYNYIARRQTICVGYASFRSKTLQEFLLYPHLLKEYRNRWFLFASRVSDQLLFTLALDRIEWVKDVPGEPYRDNPHFDPDTFFSDVIGVTKHIGDQPQTITFWVSARQANYVRTKPLHPSQMLVGENPVNHSCTFTIRVVPNYELYSVLRSYGLGLRVLSPQRVVNTMRVHLREWSALYDQKMEEGMAEAEP